MMKEKGQKVQKSVSDKNFIFKGSKKCLRFLTFQ